MTREVPNRAEEEKDHIAQKGTPNITGGGGRRRKRRLPPASAKLGLPCSLLKGAGQQTEKTSPKKIKRGKKAKHFRVRVAEREREPAPTPDSARPDPVRLPRWRRNAEFVRRSRGNFGGDGDGV